MRPSVTPGLVDDWIRLDVFINQIFQDARPVDEGVAFLAELDDRPIGIVK